MCVYGCICPLLLERLRVGLPWVVGHLGHVGLMQLCVQWEAVHRNVTVAIGRVRPIQLCGGEWMKVGEKERGGRKGESGREEEREGQ